MSNSLENSEDGSKLATIVNLEQAQAWDGPDGDDWTAHEEQYNDAVRRHTPRLLAAARINADDHVLDIGCGCGESTRAAARAAAHGSVLGIDLSARMTARARERSRSEGLANLVFQQADAQVYPFPAQAFDVAISRFGAMFFGDPIAAFQNIRRSLRPAGRLAISSWRELKQNEWITAVRSALAAGRSLPEPPPDAPGPFGLASPDRIDAVLGAAGFQHITLEPVDEPVYFGADTADAFAFLSSIGVVKGMLNDLDNATRAQALEELRAMLTAHQTAEGVLLESRAWLITARRR
jgi:SAM-dependent methyltransferase